MSRRIAGFIIMLAGISALQAAGQEPSSQSPSPASSPAQTQRALLNRYCVTCHNEKLKTAGLMLDKMDVEHVSAGAETWEKVIKKLRTYAMPPTGMPRPDKAAYDAFATYLETSLDSAAAAKPNPGRPAIHRLNRAEYSNAVRDLLGLEIDAEMLFPADDSGYGFDNIGDVLSVSPMLLDRYMSAAHLISRLAIGDTTIRMPISTYDVPKFEVQNDRPSEDLPFGARGGLAIHHTFPLDGEYVLKVKLQKNDPTDGGFILGLGSPHQLDVRLDGARVKLFTIGGETKAADSQKELSPQDIEASLEVRFSAKAGRRLVGVSFLDEGLVSEGMLLPPLVELELNAVGPEDGKMYQPGVENVTIAGPFNVKGSGDTLSRQKIFVCHPSGARDEEACAKKILSTLARRAYRRPVTDSDIDGMLKLYQVGRSGGFEAGIAMAMEGMLVSDDFLFRVEGTPKNLQPETPYRLADLDLASRLSFFLWSSIPDDQLLDLAARGKLKDNEVLQQQVKRMLADPRSKALTDNFAGQWLTLRSMSTTDPNSDVFPDFDENLRQAFEKETELFFESMLREDHTVPELLSSNYTFVNERLARHYGIPNVYGSQFRRVTLTDEARWGLLGKGSILMVTSYPNRTSPVLRGKFVLENILGTPPPPPPPNVPALQEDQAATKLTMRQRMEKHRANPVCASCHARMDPLGFALDNFDAIGKWRAAETVQTWNGYETAINKMPIDSSGVLPDGTKFQGPAELRKILLSHPEQFVGTVTEKLLTYAIGRGVEYYDQPAIRDILRQAAPSNYRWSSIILGIVKSGPFQMRMSVERTTAAGLR